MKSVGNFQILAFRPPTELARPFCFKLVSAALRHRTSFNMAIDLRDFYVITSRRGEHPDRWSWEIRRKSIPLGIRMTADGFQSEMAAQFAGKRALADFLDALSKEEIRARK
jgi:hypothetical protein